MCEALNRCSKHGKCNGCGKCKCDDGYVGQNCACIEDDCPRDDENQICSGNGECNTCSDDLQPGCTCSNGWSNDYGRTDCSCTTSEESCKHTRSEEVCSSHGECQCGKCKCQKGYKGKYCQKELDKDSVCQKLGPCINENVNG